MTEGTGGGGGGGGTALGTLMGTVYDGSGATIQGADVTVFSILHEGTTTSSGQYAFSSVAREPHAILITKTGFQDSFQLTDLTNSSLADNNFVLRKSQWPTVPVQAETGYTFTRTSSAYYGTATLQIAPQGGNDFSVGNQTGLSTADLNLEFINLNEPLPVPLPFPGSQNELATLAPADVVIVGKQAPSVMVLVKPALLSMTVPATLNLPTPDASLIGKRILHFDPHTHLWEVVSGAVAGTAFEITEGGIYGIFYENTNMIGGVNGTVAAGSVVLVGDEIVTVSGNYSNNVSIPQVHIPASGGLNVQIINPDGTMTSNSVFPISGQFATIGAAGTTEGVVINFDLVSKATGTATTEVSVDKPGEIRISLTNNEDTPLTNRIVTVNSSIGILNPSNGLTLTDENGQAKVDILAGDLTGIGTITVSAEGTTTSPLNFRIGPPDLRIGATFDNATFVENALKLGIAGDLSAGGTTTVSAELVDADGNPFTQPVAISFSSNCVQSGEADIDSPVTTVNGIAQAIYKAGSCIGVDTITATADIGGLSLSATTTLTISESITGSIQFVSAIPETISLQGTGGTESAEVFFKVVDVNNQPISGQTVNFSLSTTIGGVLLSRATDISAATGEVSAIVNSGSIPTSVRVVATVEGTAISTVSDALVISVGLPDQDSFSMSVDRFNPEGWRYDGETVTVNIRAADHFNNPVPDGTAVYFTTEGGRIDPQCNTANGGCSVIWESQNPRPAGSLTDNAGMVTIHAIAIGEEVFNDINGDGRFSSADKGYWDNNTSYDLPEAYRDDNLNGVYDVGETFFDFNVDGFYTPANGLFNGTLCTDQGIIDGVCTRDLVHVRETIVITMSDSYANVDFFDTDNNPIQVVCLRDLAPGDAGYVDNNGDGCNDVPTPGTPNCDDVGKFLVLVTDTNGNSMPNNTTVTATSSLGTMLGTSSYTIGSTIAPFYKLFSIQEECGGVPEAEIEVKITTPKGIETTAYITVLDDG